MLQKYVFIYFDDGWRYYAVAAAAIVADTPQGGGGTSEEGGTADRGVAADSAKCPPKPFLILNFGL